MNSIVKVKGIWETVFKINNPNIHESFLNQGGNSLKALLFISEINDAFNMEFLITDLFDNPSIEKFSNLIDARIVVNSPVSEATIGSYDQEYYELSTFQLRIWALSQSVELSVAYNNTAVYKVGGILNVQKFEDAFKMLLHRHSSLRTVFPVINGTPKQKILSINCFDTVFKYHDFSGNRESLQMCNAIITRDSNRSYDFSVEPCHSTNLIKLSEDNFLVTFNIHHLIEDGDSINIFFTELLAFYKGKTDLMPIVDYKDFSIWHSKKLGKESNTLQRQSQYWKERLKDYVTLNLPFDYPRPKERSYSGSSLPLFFDSSKLSSLKKIAQAENTTLFNLMYSLFVVLLSKITYQNDILVGIPVSSRNRKELDSTIGMFVNTLPFRSSINDSMSLKELVSQTKAHHLSNLSNFDVPFESVIDELKIPISKDRNPLFDVLFVWNQGIEGLLDDDELSWTSLPVERTKSIIDLMFLFCEEQDHISGYIEYSTELFSPSTIQSVLQGYAHIVDQVILLRSTNSNIGSLNLVSENEIIGLLQDSQSKFPVFSSDYSIKELFENSVGRNFEKAAVVHGSDLLTYEDLNIRANSIAKRIDEFELTNDLVGVILESSIDLIVAIVGIIKTGKVYVPIPKDFPKERKELIISESGISLLISDTDHNLSCDIPFLSTRDAKLEPSLANPNLDIESDSPLYVIHTSGTTGKPKGVMVKHRNLANLIAHQYRYTSIKFQRVLQFASIGFDVSLQEIFSSLLYGGTLYLINSEIKQNVKKLFDLIESERIQTVFLPTSYFKEIFSTLKENDIHLPSCLEHVVVAGEQLILSEKLKSLVKTNNFQLHNHYGPSETHVVTTITIGKEDEIQDIPTIGRPIANTGIYILDDKKNPLPIGIPGEIYIGGDQVGLGYLNQTELTQEKFLQVPRIEGTLYRTGDIAKWNVDRNIVFLGRKDSQIKIRGYRVELDEICTVLLNNPDIKNGAVIIRKQSNDEYIMCAYYVSDTKLEERALYEYLQAKLPEYMMPHHLIFLDKMPLTSNGKLNERELPIPYHMDKGIVGATTYTEETLMKHWKSVFGIQQVGIQCNFFELGGHSLKAMKLISHVSKDFGININMKDILELPTIEMLGRYVDTVLSFKKSQVDDNVTRQSITI